MSKDGILHNLQCGYYELKFRGKLRDVLKKYEKSEDKSIQNRNQKIGMESTQWKVR